MFVDIFQLGCYVLDFKNPRLGDVMSRMSMMDRYAGELERGAYYP